MPRSDINRKPNFYRSFIAGIFKYLHDLAPSQHLRCSNWELVCLEPELHTLSCKEVIGSEMAVACETFATQESSS